MSFKKFMTSKLTIAAIIFAIIYQFIMAIVYLPGYKHATDHLDNLRVAVVNEHKTSVSKEIASKISSGIHYEKNSPKAEKYSSLSHAKTALKDKKVLLVIVLPKDTTENILNILNGKKINLKYYHNKYSDSSSISAVDKIKTGVDSNLNKEFLSLYSNKMITKLTMQNEGQQLVKEKMATILQANPEIAANSQKMSELQQQVTNQVIKGVEKKVKSQVMGAPVHSKTYTISNHHSANTAVLLGTMLVSLGCFISVMAASILLFSQYEKSLLNGNSKLKSFFMYEMVFLLMAILAPLVSIITFKAITHISMENACEMYLQNVIMTFVSAQYVSIFSLLLGRLGLLLNLPLALVQTVISGAIMPFNLLPKIYQFFYYVLPLPYNYMANMSILSGVNHGSLPSYDLRLLIMGVIAGCLAFGISLVRKYHTRINENVS